MLFLFAVTVDLAKLTEFIKLSSILMNVWSPEAPTQVARLPWRGPTFGMGPGIAYHGHLGLYFGTLLCPGCEMSCGDAIDVIRPNCPFCNVTIF